MAEALNILEGVAEELRYIVDLPSDKLEALSTALEETSPIISRRELLKNFRDTLGASNFNSRIGTNLVSLNLLREDPDKTPDSVFESLIFGCEESGNETLAVELSKKKSEIKKLLNSETLYMSVMAYQLFTLNTQYLTQVKIISDTRPLFNPTREGFSAAILFSIMHITTSDYSNGKEQICVALRARQLDEIIQECERAKRELTSLERNLSELEEKTIVKYGDVE